MESEGVFEGLGPEGGKVLKDVVGVGFGGFSEGWVQGESNAVVELVSHSLETGCAEVSRETGWSVY